MSAAGRRQQRVSSLLQEALSQLLIEEIQNISTSLVTVTRVDVTADLMTARVFLSIYGPDDPETIIASLEKRTGFLRKALASLVKLKYNPMLFFCLDLTPEYEQRIDKLLESAKKRGRGTA
jgi:ribosome-binding factor A